MNALLDTHSFLWFVSDDPRLKPRVKEIIEEGDTTLWLSVVSLWEIVIKVSLASFVWDFSTPRR